MTKVGIAEDIRTSAWLLPHVTLVVLLLFLVGCSGQGDPSASAGLHRLQRGLRRRPDGCSHPAGRAGPGRGDGVDALEQQYSLALERPADRQPFAGYRPRLLLHDARAAGLSGRGHALLESRRSAHRL